jgi:DNA-binding IclR family transcriptional regulator
LAMTNELSGGRERRLSSVANALRALVVLSKQDAAIGVTELSQELEVGKSTAHAILVTLTEFGFVRQDPDSGRYHLGFEAFQVGIAALEQLHLGAYLTPPMERLAHTSEEAVSLAVLHQGSAVFTHRFESTQILRADIRLGTRMPLHGSASGKCLIAELGEDELELLFPKKRLEPATASTLTRRSVLLEQLREVRERGYATDVDEYVVGVSAVACPVRDAFDRTIAALSVAGPTARFDLERWIGPMLETGSEITEALAPITRTLSWETLDSVFAYRPSPGPS